MAVPWGRTPPPHCRRPLTPGKTKYFPGQAALAIFSSLTRDTSNKNPGRPGSFVGLGTELPGVAAKGGTKGAEGQQGGGRRAQGKRPSPEASRVGVQPWGEGPWGVRDEGLERLLGGAESGALAGQAQAQACLPRPGAQGADPDTGLE